MKKYILYVLTVISLILLGITSSAQQALSPNLFSQNGWMPDSVGFQNSSHDSTNCPGLKHFYGLTCHCNGHLKEHWGIIKDSKSRFVRFGGTSADQNRPTNLQYLAFVDSVKFRGMIPVLQISVNAGENGIYNTQPYDTTDAKSLVNYINNTMGEGVVYWCIGNEPDMDLPRGYGYSKKDSAYRIANYIKDYSKAMRRASNIPIKIIGPELADWSSDPGYTKKKLVDSLLIPSTLASPNRCDITGFDSTTMKPWIDIFSFHFYAGINGDLTTLPKQKLVDTLRATNGLAQTIAYLNTKLSTANTHYSRTGGSEIKSAITEANIDFQSDTTDAFSDLKCNGFFAGQYWLEIASIAAEKNVEFVSFWSSSEASMGYLKSDGTKKSTYYHFQKASANFSGTYYTAKDTSIGTQTPIKNIKAFGTKDGNHISVIIMNQDAITAPDTNRAYSIRLDGQYSMTDTNEIYLNMGVIINTADSAYHDIIERSSTTYLEFDLFGNLSQKSSYRESIGNSPPGFIQPYCGTSVTYANPTQVAAYVPGIYYKILFEPSTGNPITIGPSSNSIYRASNTLTIDASDAVFTVPLGQSFSLVPTPCY
jgi:hypothetical protein